MSGSSSLLSGTITLAPGASITTALQVDGAELSDAGAVIIAPSGSVLAQGEDALYADGAIVNQGALGLAGAGTELTIIVDNGPTASYDLTIPSFENLNTVAISQGAVLNITGTALSNQGDINLEGGTLLVSGGGVDGGQGTSVPASSVGDPNLALSLLGDAPVTIPSLASTGSAKLGGTIGVTGGGLAWFGDGVANQTVYFGGDGTVYFGAPEEISNVTIAGFGAGDTIVTDNPADAALLASKLIFTGTTAAVTPAIEEVAPCFARGSRLLTPLGYVPVESLKPGDPVITAMGDIRAVRWIGCCTVDIAAHRRPEAVRPIRFMPGALGPGLPGQALRLSPDHGLFLHGVLVPAKLLVNGATIIREAGTAAVTYYHVELDRHDVLLAEGVAVESYLDSGNRGQFSRTNGSPVFGRGKKWDALACAPLCLGGPGLRDIRQAVRARTAALGFARRHVREVSLLADGARLTPCGGTEVRPEFAFERAFRGEVTIQSGRFVPAELSLGEADEDDNRVLGVALAGIILGGAHGFGAGGGAGRVLPAGGGGCGGLDGWEWADCGAPAGEARRAAYRGAAAGLGAGVKKMAVFRRFWHSVRNAPRGALGGFSTTNYLLLNIFSKNGQGKMGGTYQGWKDVVL